MGGLSLGLLMNHSAHLSPALKHLKDTKLQLQIIHMCDMHLSNDYLPMAMSQCGKGPTAGLHQLGDGKG